MDFVKYVSSKELIAKIMTDLGLQGDTNISNLVEWIGECLEHMDVTMSYVQDVVTLNVKNYRAKLPCHFHLPVPSGIVVNGVSYSHALNGNQKVYHKEPTGTPKSEGTYSIQWPWLVLPVQECKVTVYFYAYPVDEEGMPLIPDHILCRETVVLFVLQKMKFSEMASGKCSFNEWKAFEQEWGNKSDRAKSVLSFPSPDKMQSIGAMWNRMIPRIQDFHQMGINSNQREELLRP